MSAQPTDINTGKENRLLRAMSALMDRFKLAGRAGLMFGGARDLYKVFGYKQRPDCDDFLAKYIRQDIVSRIVDAPPEATWASPPELVSTARNVSAWDKMIQPLQLWTKLQRVDRLARLGQYSVLLMGFDDKKSLEQPVKSASQLLYLRPIGERQLDILDFESDTRSPRFGKPTMYEAEFDDPTTKKIFAKSRVGKLRGIRIHHSRVLHIVENPLDDDVFCAPIVLKIYNILDDLLKVAGGTAETFWLVANRGLQADIDKEMELDPKDAQELSDMFDDYMHQLRRTLRTRGVTIKELGSQTPAPKDIFEMIISIISGATGIPKRILIGSEAGQLASEQDKANWAERIMDRRVLFAEPHILCPFVERLMEVGVFNQGDYSFKWPDAYRTSPLERAQTMAAQARAVSNFSAQTGRGAPMQITTREEARQIIGLEGDIPEDQLEETEADLKREQMDKQAQQAKDALDAKNKNTDIAGNPIDPNEE